jgi:hypothetical protein
MKNGIVCTASLGVCFAMLGCAGESRRITGFLGDCSILKPHPSVDGGLVGWNRATDCEHLRPALVGPVEVHFLDYDETIRANPEEVAASHGIVVDELITAIGKHVAIATEPGPNVPRCRFQAANLQLTRSTDAARPPWSPQDFALGTANTEADARDSISGELVAAYVSPQGRAERVRTFFLTSPPDRWEAAKTAVRSHVFTWTDHAFPRVVPESELANDGVTTARVSHAIQW